MAQTNSSSIHRCSHCSREFARSEHLNRHERTHTKEKPYECTLCRRTFSRTDLLRRHERKEHQYRWRESFQTNGAPQIQVSNNGQLPFPNTPLENFGSYAVISDSDAMGLNQPPMDQLAASSFDLPGAELQWLNENPIDFSSPDYELNPSIQGCFLPDDLDWLDNIQQNHYSFGGQEMNGLIAQPGFGAQKNTNRSILSRPGSPPLHVTENEIITSVPVRHRIISISSNCRAAMQAEINNHDLGYILPSPSRLSSFIQRYFKSFHRHQPFLQEATWSPEDAPTPLILAICANGALYSLERTVAMDLYRLSILLIENEDTGISALQTLMLLMAFSAWGGSPDELKDALRLHARATLALRKTWSETVHESMDEIVDWDRWRHAESLNRITFCLFTLMGLMDVAYDFPSTIALKDRHGLPCQEAQWCAASEEDWNLCSQKLVPREWTSAEAVVCRLGNESLPTPSNIGMFGCHVIIMTLLQKIISFRRSCSSEHFGFSELRQHFLRALKRWQLMWESEPEASLSPDHPHGPILFNCTAILRVAYIRLVTDFSSLRATFAFYPTAEDIVGGMERLPKPIRDPQTTRAVLQACLALRIPVRLGFKVVARTSFWIWSVQHALCYFECALLLGNWLQVVQNSPGLSEDEKGVMRLVQEVLSASQGDEIVAEQGDLKNLSAAVLYSWARLIDTADTTVWKIMPKMAGVLRLYAKRLERENVTDSDLST